MEDYCEQICSRLPQSYDNDQLKEILLHAEEMLTEVYIEGSTRKDMIRILRTRIGAPIQVARIVLGLDKNKKMVNRWLAANAISLGLMPSWLMLHLAYPEATERLDAIVGHKILLLLVSFVFISLLLCSFWISRAPKLTRLSFLPSFLSLCFGFSSFFALNGEYFDPVERFMRRRDFKAIERRLENEMAIFNKLHNLATALRPASDTSTVEQQKRKVVANMILNNPSFFTVQKGDNLDSIALVTVNFVGMLSNFNGTWNTYSRVDRDWRVAGNIEINLQGLNRVIEDRRSLLDVLSKRKTMSTQTSWIRGIAGPIVGAIFISFTLNACALYIFSFTWSRWHLRRRLVA